MKNTHLVLAATALASLAGCSPVAPADQEPHTDTARVEYVIDGDTVVVNDDGQDQRVRVLGINAPEDSDREVGCGGPEATAAAVELLDGQTVELRRDAKQPEQDKYGRELRHITMPDGSDFAETMLTEGHAARYTSAATDRDTELRAAEGEARQTKVGIWATPGCADDSR